MNHLLPGLSGEVTIELDGKIVLTKRNVITNTVSYLFARLLVNSAEPLFGIWGLSIGQGGTQTQGWSDNNQPDPVATVTQMVAEIKRKPLTSATFIDVNGNPTTAPTTTANFTTTFNATTDGIEVPIREMGLIGGGTSVGTATNMLTAPFFNPAQPVNGTVLLVNYFTLPPFILPPGSNMAIIWKLSF